MTWKQDKVLYISVVISTHSLTHYPRKSQLWASAQKWKSWTAVLRKHWLSTQGTNIRSSNSIISVGFSCWFVVVACLFFSPSLVIESDMSATEYSNIQSTATKTSSKPERCRFVQRPRKRQRWFSRTNSDKVFFLFFLFFKKSVHRNTSTLHHFHWNTDFGVTGCVGDFYQHYRWKQHLLRTLYSLVARSRMNQTVQYMPPASAFWKRNLHILFSPSFIRIQHQTLH